jgi:hypothetical protein
MRLPALLLPLMLLPHPVSASNEVFDGAWVAWICPSGVERSSGQCANFVLELMEKDGKLCGAHMFATAGAARIDEGAAPSLIADVLNGSAAGIVISSLTASPIRMRVELTMDNGVLSWKRLESPPGDYLLPRNARLTKAKSRTLLAPVYEQELRAACSYVFNIAAREAADGVGAARAVPDASAAPPAAYDAAR